MGPLTVVRRLVFVIFLLPVAQLANVRAVDAQDNYDIVLHSRSLAGQREALKAILADPKEYVPRIQQSLRDYPRLLRTDRRAADRVVYISALVRDPSFAPILVKSLGVPDVVEYCEYACPAVFTLTIQACFAGWKPPANLDPQLSTVHDLKHAIDYMSHTTLDTQPIEAVVQGPGLEEHRREIEGKTEEELIQLAGPLVKSKETRSFAVYKLETTVSTSRGRIELYLLALNDFEDASGDYRSALYEAIYRSEVAKSLGK